VSKTAMAFAHLAYLQDSLNTVVATVKQKTRISREVSLVLEEGDEVEANVNGGSASIISGQMEAPVVIKKTVWDQKFPVALQKPKLTDLEREEVEGNITKMRRYIINLKDGDDAGKVIDRIFKETKEYIQGRIYEKVVEDIRENRLEVQPALPRTDTGNFTPTREELLAMRRDSLMSNQSTLTNCWISSSRSSIDSRISSCSSVNPHGSRRPSICVVNECDPNPTMSHASNGIIVMPTWSQKDMDWKASKMPPLPTESQNGRISGGIEFNNVAEVMSSLPDLPFND